jgi:hypothetical protein
MGLSFFPSAQPSNRDCAGRNAGFPIAAKMPHPGFIVSALAWLIAITFAFRFAAPTLAYAEMPEVSGFSNYYPWFNEVPQDQGSQGFRYFLAYHPNIASALSYDPKLLYDADWRSQQPALEQYLANHPYVWQELNGSGWAEGPGETQWGNYDDEDRWRDAYWWHQNQPSWFYENHQQWASLDSRWLGQDGAYDNQHQWHYGEWWYNQNPNWVTSNHPGWLQQHRNWEAASEQQRYRQQQATHQSGEQNSQQQASIDRRKNQTQELNQQRQANVDEQRQANHQQQQANEQRQASLEHQRQANLEQEQATQQNRRELSQQHQADAHEQQSVRQENDRPQRTNREAAPVAHQEHQQAQQQHNGPGGDHNQH